MNLQKDSLNNYQLNIQIYDTITSKQNRKDNYYYNKSLILNWETTENVFCNSYENLDGFFLVYDPFLRKEYKRYFKGLIPILTLSSKKYYVINNEWFEKDNEYLIKYSEKLK